MMRLICFVLALLALSFISVDGASVGHRMKRESCGVMMYRTSNCSNHGYCVSDNIGPHCVCYQGWGGHLCQHAIGGRPQGSSPLTEGDGDGGDGGDDGDDGDDDGDSSTDRPAAQVTEEQTREREVTTQGIQEQTTADQNFGGDDDDDDDDDDDAMRTERPRPTEGEGDGDGAIGGGVSEGDRLAILCDDLYAQTNTCSNRQGHCSVDSIGAFCQCNAGYLGIACQYSAENVAGVLEAIVRMMRDPHYRVIGGSTP